MVSLYGGICSDSISVKVKVSETPPLAEMDATDRQVFCAFYTIRLIGQGDGYRVYFIEVQQGERAYFKKNVVLTKINNI
jgi:hypothetical protein